MKLFLLIFAVLLIGCEQPPEPSPPLGQPQYPTPSPTPTPVEITVVRPTSTPFPQNHFNIQEARWDRAIIRPEKVHFVVALSSRITTNKARYMAIQDATGVPWKVVACIHNMECSQSFREHLHNGDPMSARTRHVPANRPVKWLPPYDWESSAIDALKYDKLDRKQWTGIGETLQNVEAYNGTGYQRFHPAVPTPYLWSWSSLYIRGKYVADGRWSDTAVSDQCGVSPILKLLP